MDQNYTPLDTEKLTAKKKSLNISNKLLIGLILFFTVGVGTVGFMLTQQRLKLRVPAQVEPTISETPVPTPTGEVVITEAPVATESGQPEATQAPEITVTSEATSAPTEIPTLAPELTEAETPIPTATSAPIGGNDSVDEPSATPTEIVLVQATITPDDGTNSSNTSSQQQVTEIPSAGVATFGKIFAVLSLAVILLGLIL